MNLREATSPRRRIRNQIHQNTLRRIGEHCFHRSQQSNPRSPHILSHFIGASHPSVDFRSFLLGFMRPTTGTAQRGSGRQRRSAGRTMPGRRIQRVRAGWPGPLGQDRRCGATGGAGRPRPVWLAPLEKGSARRSLSNGWNDPEIPRFAGGGNPWDFTKRSARM